MTQRVFLPEDIERIAASYAAMGKDGGAEYPMHGRSEILPRKRWDALSVPVGLIRADLSRAGAGAFWRIGGWNLTLSTEITGPIFEGDYASNAVARLRYAVAGGHVERLIDANQSVDVPANFLEVDIFRNEVAETPINPTQQTWQLTTTAMAKPISSPSDRSATLTQLLYLQANTLYKLQAPPGAVAVAAIQTPAEGLYAADCAWQFYAQKLNAGSTNDYGGPDFTGPQVEAIVGSIGQLNMPSWCNALWIQTGAAALTNQPVSLVWAVDL